MVDWDAGDDVIVIGSGVSGLTAAFAATSAGLSTRVYEGAAEWGGTSAMSVGGVWIPVNPLMAAQGVRDSIEEAMEYLENVIGDAGPASSIERRRAYVENAARMANDLAQHGFRWRRASRWPDYHSDLPGAKLGRVVEGDLFDLRRLGAAADTMRKPETLPPIPLLGGDIADLVVATRSRRGLVAGVQTAGRAARGLAAKRRLVGMGQSLIGQLGLICQQLEIPVQRNSPLRELVEVDGRVQGVVIEQGGRLRRIFARHGVVLAGGGFSQNAELRRQYQPVGAEWSAAIPGDQGDILIAGMKIGAATANMEGAWWVPVVLPPNGNRDFLVWERSLPGSIVIDQSGRRFANESADYTTFAQQMLENDKSVPTVPAWLIIDSRHRRRYMFGGVPGGYTPRSWIKSGYLIKERSLEALSQRCGLPAAAVRATVTRFNEQARRGVDDDFGRGSTVYDNYFGDPSHRPNPNLGPVEQPPFYAVKLWPGDVGTSGGLLTDEHARVLDEAGEPIRGLYSAGNSTASVMGLRYPGPGITLGAGSVFGYIAGRHLASVAGAIPGSEAVVS
ncbi:3-oxosteroid 1-dehydrogenase [Mycolicibacterium chitae]|uniref:Succinate dehydrogenase/fumarate reductase flavoprotein subunit n=1 Tax=Mycolicibacterium chitae TaxID=1792 RepID=A0A3S4RP98_MYCCI|nr:FAD-dependent oxidoreductase [Mycolicibacterium chitae]MCV7104482.1 FAD-binding protein [Mycolicibacterium chitae]BBZ05451.1 3-oxosteroid 1-dehydrogenase [Mycolicibacterium chitae]VEG49067.1 succinate dehydrogenase/fumarate reductase flavoprotein subunit [Mycolicibacterium chitae]